VAAGVATAGVRDSGCWRPAAGAASGNGRSGGRGLALARFVCDEVGTWAGAGGTTVILRMNLPARGGRAAVTGRAPSCCRRRALLRSSARHLFFPPTDQ
jgi:hypothetical protein